jgi:hypothetical protein
MVCARACTTVQKASRTDIAISSENRQLLRRRVAKGIGHRDFSRRAA